MGWPLGCITDREAGSDGLTDDDGVIGGNRSVGGKEPVDCEGIVDGAIVGAGLGISPVGAQLISLSPCSGSSSSVPCRSPLVLPDRWYGVQAGCCEPWIL